MGRVWNRRVGIALATVAVMAVASSPTVSADAEPAAHASTTPAANRVAMVGDNSHGQLGNGMIGGTVDRAQFHLPITEMPAEVRIGLGGTYVRTASGAIYAAGSNPLGQLGDGTTTSRATPAKVALPAGVHAVSLGAARRTGIAVGDDSKVYTWGDNTFGQIGNGASGSTPVTTPYAVSLPGGAVPAGVASSSNTSFAISTAGQIYAWPFRGALTPTLLPGVPAKTFVQIEAGDRMAVARASDGTAYVWNGSYLGAGAFVFPAPDVPTTPAAMPTGVTVADVRLTNTAIVALGSDGRIYTWGSESSGELGGGLLVGQQYSPGLANLPVGVTATKISAGADQVIAQTGTGAVYAWGGNANGQTGLDPAVATSVRTPTLVPLAASTPVLGIAAGPSASALLVDDPTPTEYVPVQPERLLDTRTPEDGPSLAPGEEIALDVTGGVSDIPLDAVAVTLNVTGTEPDAPGYLTVWPCDSLRPVASNVNLAAGETAPNLVIAKMASDGTICIFSQAGAHVIVDLQGWFPWSTSYQPLTPTRVLDTRSPGAIGYAGPKPTTGQTITLPVRGIGPVPNDAGAVVLNVTATEASGAGFVTVWPCDRPRPTASNLNVPAGGTRPNSVVAKVSAAGTVCLFTQAGTHLIADVQGSFPTGSTFQPLQPERLLDTRAPGLIGYFGGKPVAGQTVTLQVTGVGTSNLPGTTSAVVLNVTGTDASGGYVTVWPCDQPRPLASNLNLAPGDTRPNLVIAKTSATGSVCLFTSGSTHLIADLAGAW